MPIQISSTTQLQVSNARGQLLQIRHELNRLMDTGDLSRAHYDFFDHLLSANHLLSTGVENLISNIREARP